MALFVSIRLVLTLQRFDFLTLFDVVFRLKDIRFGLYVKFAIDWTVSKLIFVEKLSRKTSETFFEKKLNFREKRSKFAQKWPFLVEKCPFLAKNRRFCPKNGHFWPNFDLFSSKLNFFQNKFQSFFWILFDKN